MGRWECNGLKSWLQLYNIFDIEYSLQSLNHFYNEFITQNNYFHVFYSLHYDKLYTHASNVISKLWNSILFELIVMMGNHTRYKGGEAVRDWTYIRIAIEQSHNHVTCDSHLVLQNYNSTLSHHKKNIENYRQGCQCSPEFVN